MQLNTFFDEIRQFGLEYAVETKNREISSWSNFLIFPVLGYIESCLGPISIRKVKYIHIFIIQKQFRGERQLSQFINQQQALEEILKKHAIPYIQSQDYVLSIDLRVTDSSEC